MAFSEDIKIKAMISCGRRCCICHDFCGNNMELHHIKSHAEGGEDTFDNAIPLCFNCHAIVRQYDPKHPKGIKFTAKELKGHRDAWYRKVSQEIVEETNSINREKRNIKLYHQRNHQNIKLYKVDDGKELLYYMDGVYGIAYDDDAKTKQEIDLVGDFVQYIKDLIDIYDVLDEPSERRKIAFDLTNRIIKINNVGFWIFAGIENRTLYRGLGDSELFPFFIIRIIRKDSSEIIKRSCDKKER